MRATMQLMRELVAVQTREVISWNGSGIVFSVNSLILMITRGFTRALVVDDVIVAVQQRLT